MNLCRDCAHYHLREDKFRMWGILNRPPKGPFYVPHDQCLRERSPVTGETIVLDAGRERVFPSSYGGGRCGHDGKFWKAKE